MPVSSPLAKPLSSTHFPAHCSSHHPLPSASPKPLWPQSPETRPSIVLNPKDLAIPLLLALCCFSCHPDSSWKLSIFVASVTYISFVRSHLTWYLFHWFHVFSVTCQSVYHVLRVPLSPLLASRFVHRPLEDLGKQPWATWNPCSPVVGHLVGACVVKSLADRQRVTQWTRENDSLWYMLTWCDGAWLGVQGDVPGEVHLSWEWTTRSRLGQKSRRKEWLVQCGEGTEHVWGRTDTTAGLEV